MRKIHLNVYPTSHMARAAWREAAEAAASHTGTQSNEPKLTVLYEDEDKEVRFNCAASRVDCNRFAGLRISSYTISNQFGPYMRATLDNLLCMAVLSYETTQQNARDSGRAGN